MRKRAWDEAIGGALPEYAAANKIYNEMRLIEEAYELGGKMTLKPTGEGYDQFHQFLNDAEVMGHKFTAGSPASNIAENLFYGRAIKQIIGEEVTPEAILKNQDIQNRLRTFIGNEDNYNSYVNFLLKEEAKRGVSEYLPAAQHQLNF